jgi:hypothetical protein
MAAPRRSHLWIAFAVTVVVIVAVVVGHGGDGRRAVSTGPAAKPQSQTGAGVAVPAPPLGSGGADDPGPRRTEGDVPMGFARTVAGAVAAATTYLSTLHGLALGDAGAREEAVRRMAASAAPGIVERTLAGMAFLDGVVDEARAALPGARAFLREVPVAYELSRFDRDRARVEVWSLGVVLIEGRTQATEVWSTNTVELVWEGGDWRLWSWARVPGPVPAASLEPPTDPAEVLAAINGWEGYRYVPAS